MPENADAVRRWAALHASTIGTGPLRGSLAPGPVPEPVTEAVPAVLASFTEIRNWPAQSEAGPVAWGQRPDGVLLLATSGDDTTVRIWDPDTGETLRTLTGHTGAIRSVAWGRQPDGTLLLATGSYDNTARIWDPGTGETLHALTGHTNGVCSVAWGLQPGGRLLLATASHDDTARIWDPGTGETLRTLTGHTGAIHSVDWGRQPDGTLLLATASDDHTARIWDPGTGETLRTLTGHTDSIMSWPAVWGQQPDGQLLLITSGASGITRIWNSGSGEFIDEIHRPETRTTRTPSWISLADGRMLLAMSSQDALHVWDGHTRQLLHTEALDLGGTEFKHQDWVLTHDGRLLLAAVSADGRVHVWDVVLAPPAPPPAAPEIPMSGRRNGAGIVLESVEDITPEFPDAAEASEDTFSVACAALPDSRVLLATMSLNNGSDARIWDLSTGRVNRVLAGHTARVTSAAWGSRPGWPLQLATSSGDGTVRIWDPGTGEALRTLTVDTGFAWSATWGQSPDGRFLLAAGSDDGTVRIWDSGTWETLRTLTVPSPPVKSVAWGQMPDGRLLLATGSNDGTACIWDPDTGATLHTLTGHTAVLWCAAWGQRRDGGLLLATGSGDGTVRIWDPGTGETLHTLTGHTVSVNSAAWGQLPDGGLLLATGSRDGTVRIWDPDTGVELASVPVISRYIGSVTWVSTPAGDLLLAVANSDDREGPAHVWRVRATSGGRAKPTAAGRGRAALRPGSLITLGAGGLWPPLGLVDDLVGLTGQERGAGPGGGLNDARLAVLSDDPGITRLRELGWAPAARLAFAALLASRLDIPPSFVPPQDATPAQLHDALHDALTAAAITARPASISPRDLQAAAAQITDRTATLLAILGPHACAADPLLPVRLAHRAPQLPALNRRQVQLITGTAAHKAAKDRGAGAGTLIYSPGTAGVTRTGPLTRLLPTQLALPRTLMTMRLAENQLLYRQHRAPAPPAPEPLTLLLDTTPPTYGAVEQVLRLIAHLLTTTLWAHGQQPVLITLTHPEASTLLTTPGDLIHLWTSRTLDEPRPALHTALRTAAATGRTLLLLTHHHTPAGIYTTTPATRLLTTHHPVEDPPASRANPHHHHLPPNPTSSQISRVITNLLTPGDGDR